MKQTVVIKVSMDGHKSIFGELDGQKARSKALKIAVGHSGVESASLKGQDRDQIEVKGDGIDTVKLVRSLRKNVGHADIITVAEDGEKKEDGERKTSRRYHSTIWCGLTGRVTSHPTSTPTMATHCMRSGVLTRNPAQLAPSCNCANYQHGLKYRFPIVIMAV